MPTCRFPRSVSHCDDVVIWIGATQCVHTFDLPERSFHPAGSSSLYRADDRVGLAMPFADGRAAGAGAVSEDSTPDQTAEGDAFPLSRLPPDLRAAVLQRLAPLPRVQASFVCRSWRATVGGLCFPELTLTTAQLTQPSFLVWLRVPGRAQQVRRMLACSFSFCSPSSKDLNMSRLGLSHCIWRYSSCSFLCYASKLLQHR